MLKEQCEQRQEVCSASDWQTSQRINAKQVPRETEMRVEKKGPDSGGLEYQGEE